MLDSVFGFKVERSASRHDPQLSPDDLAPVVGALAAPVVTEGRDNGEAAPAFGVRGRLVRLDVERALVPRLDHEGLLAGQQPQGDRWSAGKHDGGVDGVRY